MGMSTAPGQPAPLFSPRFHGTPEVLADNVLPDDKSGNLATTRFVHDVITSSAWDTMNQAIADQLPMAMDYMLFVKIPAALDAQLGAKLPAALDAQLDAKLPPLMESLIENEGLTRFPDEWSFNPATKGLEFASEAATASLTPSLVDFRFHNSDGEGFVFDRESGFTIYQGTGFEQQVAVFTPYGVQHDFTGEMIQNYWPSAQGQLTTGPEVMRLMDQDRLANPPLRGKWVSDANGTLTGAGAGGTAGISPSSGETWGLTSQQEGYYLGRAGLTITSAPMGDLYRVSLTDAGIGWGNPNTSMSYLNFPLSGGTLATESHVGFNYVSKTGVEVRDTGVREVSPVGAMFPSTAKILVRRVGPQVEVLLKGGEVAFTAALAAGQVLYTLPLGFRPYTPIQTSWGVGGGVPTGRLLTIATDGRIILNNVATAVASGAIRVMPLSFSTRDTFPVTMPGTALP